MKEKIVLSKPLMVNGVARKEFEADSSLISVDQFAIADAKAQAKMAATGGLSLKVVETDVTMQTYLGMFAIIAVNPEVDITDLERITGNDIMKIYRIGRNFIKANAEDEEDAASLDYEDDTSDVPAEATVEPSIAK